MTIQNSNNDALLHDQFEIHNHMKNNKKRTGSGEHDIQILCMPVHEFEEDTTFSYREHSLQMHVLCTASHAGKAPSPCGNQDKDIEETGTEKHGLEDQASFEAAKYENRIMSTLTIWIRIFSHIKTTIIQNFEHPSSIFTTFPLCMLDHFGQTFHNKKNFILIFSKKSK